MNNVVIGGARWTYYETIGGGQGASASGPGPSGVHVEATLRSQGRANTSLYVVEIVVEQGPMLSVPNEAIIEEGDKRGRDLGYVHRTENGGAPDAKSAEKTENDQRRPVPCQRAT